MERPIVKTRDLGTRLPEHGRIRLGVKTGSAMKSIDTFRFTSPDREAIETLAKAHGGTVQPWNDPKASPPKQWQVISEAKRIRIVLPPGSLSTWYEQWTGGGCVIRCDGEVAQMFTSNTTGPCQCELRQKMTCRPYTRLNAVLLDLRFAGTWRLESKGWNAAHEISAMEQILAQIQDVTRTPVVAVLSLEQRSQVKNGKKSNFVVPRLEFEQSMLQLASGEGRLSVQSLGVATPPVAALSAPKDDEVIDAEVVQEDDVRPKEWAEKIQATFPGESIDARLLAGAAHALRMYGFAGSSDEDLLNKLTYIVTKGEGQEWEKATTDTKTKIEGMLQAIVEKKAAIREVEGGSIRVVRIT